MKKIVFVVLLLFASVSVAAVDKHDFLELVENTDYCFDCYTIYKVTKASPEPLQNFGLAFKNKEGSLTSPSFEFSIEQNEIRNETEDIVGQCDEKAFSEPNGTSSPPGFCVKGVKQVQKVKKVFKKTPNINSFHGLYNSAPLGTTFFIKISGKLGKDEAIDNVITLNQYSYPEYAWWNSSFSFRLPINCSSVDNGLPIIVNGRNGFNISGNNQLVWTLCSGGNLSVYYNSHTDYVIANDSGQVPFDVEKGNRAGYNSSGVWTGYRVAYHYNQTSGTNLPDATSNSYSASFSQGTGWTTSGYVGNGYSFNGANDYAGRGSILSSAPTAYTFVSWVYPVDWASSSQPVVYGHQESNKIRNLLYRSASNVRSLVNLNGIDYEAQHPYTNISNNAWHLIASVWNGTHDNFYLNGTLVASVNATGTYQHGSANPIFNLGGNQGIGGYFFKGYLDETRFISSALSSQKLNQMFSNGQGVAGYGTTGDTEINLASEQDGRNAIEQGVVGSELQTYSIETDHQLTIRLLNGSQYTGIFDKYVSSANKRWGFNYDPSTPPSLFFNITPTFYVLQLYNTTFDSISQQVSGFINATN